MPDLANAPSADQQFFAELLGRLSEKLAHPSDDLPGVRCLSRPTLTHLVGEILRSLARPGFRDTSARTLIHELTRAGVATPVPLEQPAHAKRRYTLYGMGLGADVEMLHPIEVLQAAVPAGIVCYFTALQVYELTTQPPSQYHIATYRNAAPAPSPSTDYEPIHGAALAGSAPPRLGTLLFSRQGMPYYWTRRDPRWLRQTQTRYLNEKTRFQVTTLEQTLIDTVHRPASCGGPFVVFEAWEQADGQYSGEQLARLLRDIDDADLTRRVGYTIEALGHRIAPPLAELLGATQRLVSPSPLAAIPLFPGIPYHRHDVRWGLWVE